MTPPIPMHHLAGKRHRRSGADNDNACKQMWCDDSHGANDLGDYARNRDLARGLRYEDAVVP
jgi:hypothetical protein